MDEGITSKYKFNDKNAIGDPTSYMGIVKNKKFPSQGKRKRGRSASKCNLR